MDQGHPEPALCEATVQGKGPLDVRAWWIGALVFAGSGCFEPPDVQGLECSETRPCSRGFVCSPSSVCQPVGSTIDAGSPDDAGSFAPDLGVGDGGAPCDGSVDPDAPEPCDGRDNNCDGRIDEGCACRNGATQPCYAGPDGTEGVADCRGGEQTCIDGLWTPCVGQVLPELERCNQVDDDCDGTVDNGTSACGGACPLNDVPGSACDAVSNQDLDTCADDTYACDGLNALVCENGGDDRDQDNYSSGLVTCGGDCLDADPGAHPGATELCNGVDDNCDGTTDEGCACAAGTVRSCYAGPAGTEGVSVCRGGTQECVAGTWSTCEGQVLPTQETCNEIDDDCDGTVDNGSNGCGGACLLPEAPGAPCDALTANDLDLCPDDAFVCDGINATVCTNGGQDADGDNFSAGALTCRGDCQDASAAIHPNAVEACNGVDDDCDGTVDEGCDPLIRIRWQEASFPAGATVPFEVSIEAPGGLPAEDITVSTNLGVIEGAGQPQPPARIVRVSPADLPSVLWLRVPLDTRPGTTGSISTDPPAEANAQMISEGLEPQTDLVDGVNYVRPRGFLLEAPIPLSTAERTHLTGGVRPPVFAPTGSSFGSAAYLSVSHTAPGPAPEIFRWTGGGLESFAISDLVSGPDELIVAMEFPDPNGPYGDFLYVCSASPGAGDGVFRVDPSGGFSVFSSFNNCNGMAFDPQGSLGNPGYASPMYVHQTNANLQRITPSGVLDPVPQTFPVSIFRLSLADRGFMRGSLLLFERAADASIWTLSDAASPGVSWQEGLAGPLLGTVYDDPFFGNAAVVSHAGTGEVRLYREDTTSTAVVSGLSDPRMSRDPDGGLWIVERGRGQVLRLRAAPPIP